MKLRFTLSLFLMSITLAQAQYDWTYGELILKSGTTLKGQIKLPVISKDLISINGKEKVKFRKDKKAKKETYDETQVEQIVFKYSDTETAHYEYVPITKNKQGIFKIITKGKATLYGKNVNVSNSGPMYIGGANGGAPIFWNYSFSDFNEFYVFRDNEELASPLITIRLSRSFKQRFMEYFADCPTVVSKLEEKEYRKENIMDMVEAYNNCQ